MAWYDNYKDFANTTNQISAPLTKPMEYLGKPFRDTNDWLNSRVGTPDVAAKGREWGGQLGQMGLGDNMRLQDSSAYRAMFQGEETPWGERGKKGMRGSVLFTAPYEPLAMGTHEIVEKGFNEAGGGDTPFSQMIGKAGKLVGQDIETVGEFFAPTPQAPETPKVLEFDPNQYTANDYSSYQNAMRRNITAENAQQRKQAKAATQKGVGLSSADYGASQAGLQGDLARQYSGLGEDIAQRQAEDKYRAYQDAIAQQQRDYGRQLEDYSRNLQERGGRTSDFFGRAGMALGAWAGGGQGAGLGYQAGQGVGSVFNAPNAAAMQTAQGNYNQYGDQTLSAQMRARNRRK